MWGFAQHPRSVNCRYFPKRKPTEGGQLFDFSGALISMADLTEAWAL